MARSSSGSPRQYSGRRPSRARRAATRHRPRWRWLLTCAAILTIAGLGLLAWTRTPAGEAALLNLGADKFYAPVQSRLSEAIATVLPSAAASNLSARDGPGRHAWPAPVKETGAVIHCQLLPVPGEQSFWEVQAALVAAIRPAGGRILWGERLARSERALDAGQQDEPTDLLRLDLGVRGRPTHTLLLYKDGSHAPEVHWGSGPAPQANATAAIAGPGEPAIALVIDDWGYFENDVTRQLLKFELPLTLAILPRLPFSRRFALEATDLAVAPAAAAQQDDPGQRARRAGLRRQRLAAGCPVEFSLGRESARPPARRREVILHLPMEPENYPVHDPGPGAVMVGMDTAQIEQHIDSALAALPGVTGVSNHMGSRATADEITMAAVMRSLARRDLFFLDSMTTPVSVARGQALRADVPYLRSQIFLDQADRDPDEIRRNLARLLSVAYKTGFAVGICHPYFETLEVLRQELPRLKREGIRFVTLSEMLALEAVGRGQELIQ